MSLGYHWWRYRFEAIQSWIKSPLGLCHYMGNKCTSELFKAVFNSWEGPLNSLGLDRYSRSYISR